MRLLLGEQSTVVLASLKVVPTVAERLGYQFLYPTHEQALRSVLLGELARA
jgi:NAD dependent epimerase/dehydratase family enzyme